MPAFSSFAAVGIVAVLALLLLIGLTPFLFIPLAALAVAGLIGWFYIGAKQAANPGPGAEEREIGQPSTPTTNEASYTPADRPTV
jgi:hypothetical protein